MRWTDQSVVERYEEVAKELADKTEASIMESLNSLIERGLLVWQQTELRMVSDPMDFGKVKVCYSGRLILKNEEYVKQLEHANDVLQKRVRMFEDALKGFGGDDK